jgi:RNA polymerase sigma-70 factor (ECF subfamily)
MPCVSTIRDSGEPADLQLLVKRFHAAVRRRARRILGDADQASDIAQEVFLRAMRVPNGALRTNPRAWLYRVTINLCLNQLRDSKRRHKLLAERPPDAVVECTEGPGAIAWLLRDVPHHLLSPAISYYVEELSHAEIAARAGISRRTVGNRIIAFHAFVRRLDEPREQRGRRVSGAADAADFAVVARRLDNPRPAIRLACEKSRSY